jgi:probable F420-dependent oxidoreductase
MKPCRILQSRLQENIKMKFGAVLPTCEIGNDPIVLRDFAQAAEALGYSDIVVYDHVVGAEHANRTPPLTGPYTEEHPFHEPFVLLAWMAAHTRTIGLTTGVLVLPQRQTVLVAKQAAELAILSGNRFRLGVGTGWNYVEYDALGMSFADRGAMLDEQVDLLRKLWREPLLSYAGRWHKFERGNIAPRPQSSIPIWFGGASMVAVRRAVRTGDGFNFGASNPFFWDLGRRCRDLLDKSGRNRANFSMESQLGFGDGPASWHATIAEWEKIGVDRLHMRAMTASTAYCGEADAGFTRPQQHIDALRTFMSEVRGS